MAAYADELTVGALRDQDGGVVAGALITAVDASGTVLARDHSAADGTFAVTTASRPAAVLISARDADGVRVPVSAVPGVPVTAIVRRHRAADAVPSAADVAALPAGALDQVASMIPYRVTFPSSIADRFLSRGRGVTTVEGLSFYREGDGGNATGLLPAHSFGSVDVRDTLQAPWYGDRGGGGTLDARLFDRSDVARATSRDVSLLVGTNPGAFAAESFDPDGARRLFAARAAAQVGPYSASLLALAGSAPVTHYAGAAADLRAATRTLDLAAHVALTANNAVFNGTTDDGSVTSIIIDGSARGPDALSVRARWRSERDVLGIEDEMHHDGALVVGSARGNVLRATAAVAFTYGDEHSIVAHTNNTAFAILPAISLDAPLGEFWTVHAGARSATLDTPEVAIARSSLGEVSVRYTNLRRVRAELVAFTEGDTAPTAINRGFAASIGWEIAPRLSLRAWSLRDGDLLSASVPAVAGSPSASVQVGRTFNRDAAWLTWDAPTRLDVLVRGGTLEGNVRVPLGRRYALTLGSFIGHDAKRTTSLGLVAR